MFSPPAPFSHFSHRSEVIYGAASLGGGSIFNILLVSMLQLKGCWPTKGHATSLPREWWHCGALAALSTELQQFKHTWAKIGTVQLRGWPPTPPHPPECIDQRLSLTWQVCSDWHIFGKTTWGIVQRAACDASAWQSQNNGCLNCEWDTSSCSVVLLTGQLFNDAS